MSVKEIIHKIYDLYAWRARWEQENPDFCEEFTAQEHLDEQLLFSTVFYFSSLRQADVNP
jgi:hypothetical protein